ncbi:MAG: hypothetical protein WC765_07195 [Phycisphaerae bacterium]
MPLKSQDEKFEELEAAVKKLRDYFEEAIKHEDESIHKLRVVLKEHDDYTKGKP